MKNTVFKLNISYYSHEFYSREIIYVSDIFMSVKSFVDELCKISSIAKDLFEKADARELFITIDYLEIKEIKEIDNSNQATVIINKIDDEEIAYISKNELKVNFYDEGFESVVQNILLKRYLAREDRRDE